MLLKDILYHIIDSEKAGDTNSYTLRVLDTYPPLKGHFPGSPVLPGVCILQMFKELAETELAIGKPLVYSEIKQCKFLLPIAMEKSIDLIASITLKQDGECWSLSGTLKSEEAIFTTLKAVLTTKQ